MGLTGFLRYYWPSIFVVAVVLYATLWPEPLPDDTPGLFPHADKLIHAVLMGGIVSALLFDRTRHRGGSMLAKRNVLTVTCVVMIFSVVDELGQGLMGLGRETDILDLLADWAGCWLAALLAPPAIRLVLRKNR